MLINTLFPIWISKNFVVTLYYKGGTTRFLPFFGPKMVKTSSKVVKTRSDVVKITSDVVRKRSEIVSFSVGFGVKKCDLGAQTTDFVKKTKIFLAR